MPNIDMPIEELKKYMGCSPKAEKFDEFWDEKVKSIKNEKISYRMSLAELQIEGVLCYDLYFLSEDGAEIYCKYARPKEEGKYPTFFNFHGYHCDSGEWFDKIALAKLGYNIFAMDSRGQGGKSQDNLQTKGSTLPGHIVKGVEEGPNNLLFTKIFCDTVYLVELAKYLGNVDERKMYTFGASQGGALSIACGALNKEIAKVFACYPFLCDYKRVFDMPSLMGAYGEINQYFKFSDPLHKKEKEFFDTLSYIDLQNFAENMECELTMFTGLMDNICAPSSQFAFYNKFKGEKEVIIYPQHGHEWMPFFMDTILKKLLTAQA